MSFNRSITIDHTKVNGGSNLTNFTVLFSGTYTYLKTVANGGKVQNASGFDILFWADSGLTTPLKFERVTWSATTGACEFHVKVPSVSASVDTAIYVSYGDNSISTDQQDKVNTWDSDFVAVYHFGDGTTVDFVDSKGVNSGTGQATPTAGASLLGGAGGGSVQLTAASSQWIDIGNDTSLRIVTGMTIEAIVHPDSQPGSGNYPCVVSKRSLSVTGYNMNRHDNAGFLANSMYFESGSTDVPASNANNIGMGDTKTVTASYNGSNQGKFFIDGVLIDTQTLTTISDASSQNAAIGALPAFIGVIGQYWDGRIDEVRVSKVQRTDGWIITTNASIRDPASFYTIGSEGGGATPITISIADSVNSWLDGIGNSGYKFIALSRADAMNMFDGISVAGGDPDFHLVFGDRLILRDSLSIVERLSKVVTDSINNFADALAKMVGIPIQAFDSNMDKWSDALVVNLRTPLRLTFTDSMSFSDVLAYVLLSLPIPITVFDSMNNFFDAIRLWNSVSMAVGDNLVMSDVLQMRLSNLLKIVDSMSLTDFVRADIQTRPHFGDTMILSDGVTFRMAGNSVVAIGDSMNSFSDSVTKQLIGAYSDQGLIRRIRRYLSDTN